MAELSLARLMLRSAGHDIATRRVLASRRDIPDTILGFHAQQACEKCVKALLSAGNIERRALTILSG